MRQRGRKSQAQLSTPPLRVVESPEPLPPTPPPQHLSAEMQDFWRQTLTDYILEPHHLKLLEAACDAWDRMVQARRTILKEGLTIAGRDAPKTHPAVAVERDSRIAFERT